MICFYKDAFCEHCGVLEPFTAVVEYEDGAPPYCLWCAHADGEITVAKINEAEREEAKHKIKYFKVRIKELEDEIKRHDTASLSRRL